ncbi:MAG: hypothetical protein ACREQQ_06750 [Candidatus Binatia bacterium]
MRRTWLALFVSAILMQAVVAGAHDALNDEANDVAPNRRDNIIPFFDAGDPRTRYDSDPTNDESRENAETRRARQRWRDEVRGDGSTGEVGDGCMDQYCYEGVSINDGEENQDILRFDHTLSVGPASQQGDWNRFRIEALGAGGVVYLGDTMKAGPLGLPDGNEAGVYDPNTGRGSPDSPEGEPDLEPDAPPSEAPSSIHYNHSPDHAWLGLAHSSSQHGDTEFSSHDTHGGTIWADIYLPSEDDPTRTRDSNAGNSIIEHLGCPTCTDEYHEVWADPERTIFQIGEIPGQTEQVGRNPDRWIGGHQDDEQPPDQLNSPTKPVSDAIFDSDVWAAVEAANSSLTGVGAAQSPCCAPKPCTSFDENNECTDPNAGKFCNRNLGGSSLNIVESQALGGCVEVDAGNCFGGATTNGQDTQGCMVVNGEPMIHMEPATAEECTIAAVDACCANGACL